METYSTLRTKSFKKSPIVTLQNVHIVCIHFLLNFYILYRDPWPWIILNAQLRSQNYMNFHLVDTFINGAYAINFTNVEL